MRLIWLVSFALIGAAGASSRDDVGDIRFSISVATTRRTALADSVVPFFIEMRNSSPFSVVASAGYRDPPIEVHIWSARGEDIVKLPNADLADGSAFKEVPNRRLVAVRFDVVKRFGSRSIYRCIFLQASITSLCARRSNQSWAVLDL